MHLNRTNTLHLPTHAPRSAPATRARTARATATYARAPRLACFYAPPLGLACHFLGSTTLFHHFYCAAATTASAGTVTLHSLLPPCTATARMHLTRLHTLARRSSYSQRLLPTVPRAYRTAAASPAAHTYTRCRLRAHVYHAHTFPLALPRPPPHPATRTPHPHLDDTRPALLRCAPAADGPCAPPLSFALRYRLRG